MPNVRVFVSGLNVHQKIFHCKNLLGINGHVSPAVAGIRQLPSTACAIFAQLAMMAEMGAMDF